MLAAVGNGSPDQYVQPLDIAQAVRLELTPAIDGRIDKEEWDPLGNQTYLQWEPGRIYAAAQTTPGKDLVLSIDGKGDGWLVGDDNLEFRVTVKDGKAIVTVRELDATAVKQPVWRDRKDLETASFAQARTVGDVTTIEAAFDDAGLKILPRADKAVSLRLDAIDSTAESAPYLPRLCSDVKFDDHRSIALPSQMDSEVEARSKSVVPGEDIKLRLTFHGNTALGAKTIDLRTLGDAETDANRMSILFPAFDNKNRAFVDYHSRIDPGASQGYRIVRGTVAFKDGPAGIVEASYRIAPYLDFNILRANFDRLPEDNTLRVPFVLQTYSRQMASGIVRIEPPKGWQITKGDGQKFSVSGEQSRDSRRFEALVPADAHGTFAIKITGETKKTSVNQICYVTIR